MQVLNETSMRDLMDANKYSGKPTYENIFSKLVITTNTIKISKNDSAQIVKSILNLSDVISCEYHPSKYSLVVKSKKQDNVYKVIDVKGVLVPYKLIINFNEETIYTIKK